MEEDQEIQQHFDLNASSSLSISKDEDDEIEEGEIVESSTKVKKINFKLGNHEEDGKQRVCEVCKRSFSSGKALGGHMRVHNSDLEVNRKLKLKVKPKKMKKMKMKLMYEIPSSRRDDDEDLDANPSCTLCKKTFPSMKSLFGHMRCHPEREWRGIRPPPKKAAAVAAAISDSSTSTVEEEEEEDTEIVSSPPASFNLPSWSLTAKRGRKSLNGSSTSVSFSDSDQQIEEKNPESLSNLMMLAHYAHLESLNLDSSSSSLANKRKFNFFEVMKMKLGYDEESDDDSLRSAKKVKVREVEEMEYKCSTCNKCFGSHQALGGHRSKLCKTIVNSAAYEEDDDMINIGSSGSPSKQQLHKCKICDKTFSSGQALGGHKRCHWNGPLPVESLPPPALPPATITATSSVASKQEEAAANDRMFMFDLNELPTMEDEQGGGEGFCASS